MALRTSRKSFRIVNTQNVLLGIPIVVAFVFSFGFVMMHPGTSGETEAHRTAQPATKKASTLPSSKVTEQPVIDTSSEPADNSSVQPNTSSPQNPASTAPSSAKAANQQNSAASSPAQQATDTVKTDATTNISQVINNTLNKLPKIKLDL